MAEWFSRLMPSDVTADQFDRLEVIDSVRPRLSAEANGRDIDPLINSALDELTPANVTTYLPILVERRVRDQLRVPG